MKQSKILYEMLHRRTIIYMIDGAAQMELSSRLTTVTAATAALEKKGLITRQSFRDKVFYTLSPLGKERASNLKAVDHE